MLQHRRNVIGRVILPIRSVILGNIGRRIAARVEGDASILAREPSHLGFPFAMVGAELMHENDRMTGPGLLEVQFYSR